MGRPKLTAKPLGTAERWRRDGKVAVMLGIPRKDHQKIKDAAKREGRSMAQFIIFHSVYSADKS